MVYGKYPTASGNGGQYYEINKENGWFDMEIHQDQILLFHGQMEGMDMLHMLKE